jgi:hypothetical protein
MSKVPQTVWAFTPEGWKKFELYEQGDFVVGPKPNYAIATHFGHIYINLVDGTEIKAATWYIESRASERS